MKSKNVENIENINFTPSNEHLKVFSNEEELQLADYLKQASNMHYGLSINETRKLAYEFAVKNGKNMRDNWEAEKMAGREWLFGFRTRHRLSLRAPEPTSLSRATSFNRYNVTKFFENLGSVLERHHFLPQDIYNLDETSKTQSIIYSNTIY